MTREEFYKLTDILNSDVLGNFMHGGEADELISMFEETIEKSGMLREEPAHRTKADVEEAMQDVDEKSKAFTDANKSESAEEILAQMKSEEPILEVLANYLDHVSHEEAMKTKDSIDRWFAEYFPEPVSKPLVDIEIPFGSMDSELIEESIAVPEGCHAVIEGNRVVIRKGEEPVSEDLEEAAKRYATEGDEISGLCIIDEEVYAFKAGAKWQKQQMKAKAIDGDITFDYYGDDDKTYGCIAHDSFRLEDFGLKDRDKVKIIVIKEE